MTEQVPNPSTAVDDLCDLTARLKHDLGKYIAFQSRWLDGDSGVSDLRAALVADLLETHRGPDGSRSALEIWNQQRVHIEPLLCDVLGEDDADWHEISAGMSHVERALPHLESADAAALGEAQSAAKAVSDGIARLHRRVRKLTS